MPYEVNVRALAPFGLLNMRADAAAQASIEAALGFSLPREPNTMFERNELLALWFGPDEWLLRASDGAEIPWATRLRQAVTGKHGAVTPVSDAYAVFEISGPEACEVLRQGTGIDLHPRAFEQGRCARVRFAKTRALLYQAGSEPSYHVYVPRSFGDYAMQWLQRSRGE